MEICLLDQDHVTVDESLDSPTTLVVIFGAPALEFAPTAFDRLRARFPTSIVIGCSTAGHFTGSIVADDGWSGLAVRFERTKLRLATTSVEESGDALRAGRRLASQLDSEDLTAVLVLSDGTQVNGSELVTGLTEGCRPGTEIAGGLAGDQAALVRTWVLAGEHLSTGRIAAVGLYGESVRCTYGSKGGWETFGPARRITRSENNKVYEIDGQPALELYKSYLGVYAKGLPGSALLFPLHVHSPRSPRPVVRTVLSVNEADQSMTFAGQVPEGSTAQLMRASADMLLDGAMQAAEECGPPDAGGFALGVSCVGRRLALGERFDEELEAVLTVFGPSTPLIGFYSNGEISTTGGYSELHNQTMTLVSISER